MLQCIGHRGIKIVEGKEAHTKCGIEVFSFKSLNKTKI